MGVGGGASRASRDYRDSRDARGGGGDEDGIVNGATLSSVAGTESTMAMVEDVAAAVASRRRSGGTSGSGNSRGGTRILDSNTAIALVEATGGIHSVVAENVGKIAGGYVQLTQERARESLARSAGGKVVRRSRVALPPSTDARTKAIAESQSRRRSRRASEVVRNLQAATGMAAVAAAAAAAAAASADSADEYCGGLVGGGVGGIEAAALSSTASPIISSAWGSQPSPSPSSLRGDGGGCESDGSRSQRGGFHLHPPPTRSPPVITFTTTSALNTTAAAAVDAAAVAATARSTTSNGSSSSSKCHTASALFPSASTRSSGAAAAAMGGGLAGSAVILGSKNTTTTCSSGGIGGGSSGGGAGTRARATSTTSTSSATETPLPPMVASRQSSHHQQGAGGTDTSTLLRPGAQERVGIAIPTMREGGLLDWIIGGGAAADAPASVDPSAGASSPVDWSELRKAIETPAPGRKRAGSTGIIRGARTTSTTTTAAVASTDPPTVLLSTQGRSIGVISAAAHSTSTVGGAGARGIGRRAPPSSSFSTSTHTNVPPARTLSSCSLAATTSAVEGAALPPRFGPYLTTELLRVRELWAQLCAAHTPPPTVTVSAITCSSELPSLPFQAVQAHPYWTSVPQRAAEILQRLSRTCGASASSGGAAAVVTLQQLLAAAFPLVDGPTLYKLSDLAAKTSTSEPTQPAVPQTLTDTMRGEIDAIFDALDANGDGIVTMNELFAVVERSRAIGVGTATATTSSEAARGRVALSDKRVAPSPPTSPMVARKRGGVVKPTATTTTTTTTTAPPSSGFKPAPPHPTAVANGPGPGEADARAVEGAAARGGGVWVMAALAALLARFDTEGTQVMGRAEFAAMLAEMLL